MSASTDPHPRKTKGGAAHMNTWMLILTAVGALAAVADVVVSVVALTQSH
jgi:hypothetical protein